MIQIRVILITNEKRYFSRKFLDFYLDEDRITDKDGDERNKKYEEAV